jgi:hypothetical protein
MSFLIYSVSCFCFDVYRRIFFFFFWYVHSLVVARLSERRTFCQHECMLTLLIKSEYNESIKHQS